MEQGNKRNTVSKYIEEAKDRNENQNESEDTKGKKKWFCLVPKFFWQYDRGKDLEDKKQRVQQPWELFWRILGFVSSIVAFTCFALSPSFYDLFGRWNQLKSAIYCVVSLILTTSTLLIKKCSRFSRSVVMKANVGFLVMMLTSLCSIWQDRVSQKENDEKGSRGRILNMCSFGAFGLMSLSLSRLLEFGFEVGIFNFLLGSFLVLLMKMNFKLAPLAAILCYVIINIRSFSDKLGRADSSDTVLLEDIGSGSRTIHSQPMNVPEHSLHQGISDKAMQELKYLCCYKSYVDEFEEEKTSLSARRNRVVKGIEEAKDRNENQIESEVEVWLDRANGLIQEVTEGKKKWFGLIPNCFWLYNRGKELEEKTQRIKELVDQSNNFTRVARSTGLPGIEFYSNENFMQLKDRKLQFENLIEALKDENKFVIGLYGLGGTGKTTMAIEVGKKVAESKVFDKVIFSVVSKDADLKKIRDNIAEQLNLPLKEGTDESEQAKELWKRIAEGEEKVLLILDDVWEKLSLLDIGIPLGRLGKSCCSMLLTTRDRSVCNAMGCRELIELYVLSEQDAVDLFLSYAGQSIDDSSNDFKDVASDIVNECGRLSVAIVAMARALNCRPLIEWKQALVRLRNPKSIHDVYEDVKGAYNSLRLSYDYLKNEEAKKLFLLCSLFPNDYEIPIELLSRIAIGMGLCGRAHTYAVARSYFSPIKNELMDSCLLLKAENEAVKMHEVVREVALWIGNKLVQVGMDSSTTLMENIQYSSWNINDFPSHFDGRKLEVLLLWISNNAYSSTVKVPNGIFEGMKNLKVLALMNWSNIRISGASLFQSHLSLINARTLAIKGFELGDISILANLKSLESLELNNCSMIELPKEIIELEKLRFLEMVQCDIERNNPFEVIGSCLQLEELYFVSNRMDEDTCESLTQISTFPELKRYHIKAWHPGSCYKVDFSILGYFDSEYLRVNFSDEIFKSLVARAEVLKLYGDYYNKGSTNVVPDILPVKDEKMEDHLIGLRLQSMNGIKCLIRTDHLRYGMAIFSKLVELELCQMDVRELCCGPYPVNFLKQLEKLHLSWCKNLKGSLFDGKLELCNLKSIHLHECSVTCLFHPFTAESLKQLERLYIVCCFGLKYIVAEPIEDQDPNKKSHVFPKLKYLELKSCPELEFILPIGFSKDLPLLESMEIAECEKLEYIFGQYRDERDLHQIGKEAILQSLEELKIAGVPNFINLYAECYLPCPQKSSPSTYHPSASTNHNEAMKVKYVVNRAHALFTPPLYPYTLLRRLNISGLNGLKSLFTLSIASSLKLLEILTIGHCNTLEHIVTDKEDDHDHMNVNSIFPNLREVEVFYCRNLEYLFPAFYSKDFKDLELVSIDHAEKLTHVLGKCQADQNHIVDIDHNLPALKRLDYDLNKKSHDSVFLKLKYLKLKSCPELEFILPIGFCKNLPVLESMEVVDCEKLEYIFGQYQDERDLHYMGKEAILQSLKELKILRVPNFISLYAECYLPCPQKSSPSTYHSSASTNHNEAMKVKYVVNRAHALFTPPLFPYTLLRRMEISNLVGLKSLFTLSIASSLKLLEELKVEDCDTLEHIVIDKEDDHDYDHMNVNSIFPNLRVLKVFSCSNLEYLFLAFYSKDFKNLELVSIDRAEKLTHVFRKCQADQNHNVHIDLNLPALKRLDYDPNKKSHDSVFPKLKYLELKSCPELEFILPIGFCKDLPLLESMEVVDCEKLEYIFGQYRDERDLHQMGKEAILQSLEELKILRVPNFINLYAECYLPFPKKSSPSTYHPSASTNHNKAMKVNYVVNRAHGLFTPPLYPYTLLKSLEISELVGLKSLFTLSIVSSLKLLEILEVKSCHTLEHIVTDKEDGHDHINVNSIFPNLREVKVLSCSGLESLASHQVFFPKLVSIIEDQENTKKPMAPHQVLFPELRTIEVRDCKSMEYLFSVSSGKIPQLLNVDIEDTPQLGEVFRWKLGEGQKVVMEDVFPKLCMIRLVNLPTLHTICQGIDFHTVELRRVRDCPAICLASANDSYDELIKLRQSFERNSVYDDEDSSYITGIIMMWAVEIEVEGSQQDIGNDSIMPQQDNGSPNFANGQEVSKKIDKEDSIQIVISQI